jgi:hypothetical protein
MRTPLLNRADKMVLGLAVWLCTLPLAFAVTALLNVQAGIATALGLLLVTTALCWILCGYQVVRGRLRRH